jgi:hypothetical protein
LTFGFGDETICRRVEVRFMDGTTQTIENPPVDSMVDVIRSTAPAQADENVKASDP